MKVEKSTIRFIVIIISVIFCFEVEGQIKPELDHGFSPLQSLNYYRDLVVKNPSDENANYWFLYYCDINKTNAEQQYTKWIAQNPGNAILPMSLGNSYLNIDNIKANYYLNKAVAINPGLVQAWSSLITNAEIDNDSTKLNRYFLNALKANPNDAELKFRYANSFKSSDSIKFRELLQKNAEAYSDNEYGAKSILLLALSSPDYSTKIVYYELLRQKFSPQKFRVSSNAMCSYFNLLATKDFGKALFLVKEMSMLKIQYEDWDYLLMEIEKVQYSKKLMLADNWKEAAKVLDSLKFPVFVDQPSFLINKLRAEILEQICDTKCAYDSLIRFYKKKPTSDNYNLIYTYGYKLSKDSSTIKSDISTNLKKYSEKATNFNLKRADKGDSLSLDYFKGKKLLLTYYFPTCGPCRTELKVFEEVLKKNRGDTLTYVGININRTEDDIVISFLEANSYSFIPLLESKYRNKGNLENGGAAPVNFLIDREGYIIFKDFTIDENNKQNLETMIELLN